MSKLPKHLLGLSKADLESTCVDCGLCCYASAPIPFGKSNVLVPELRCKHLKFDSTEKSCCSVYEKRHDVAKGWCLPLAEAIAKGVFPQACPYVKDIEGYVGAEVLPDAEYKALKPRLVDALSKGGKPKWASSSHWETFIKNKK